MNCPITNLAWGQHIHLCPWCHSLSSAQGLHPCNGPFSLYNNQFASLYSIIPNLQACYDVCLPKNKKNSNTSCPSSHSPITLLETKSLTIYPVFNSSPPLFSWTHCTKTLLVKVTNDYRINKSNSLFLVLISPSTVFIIWLSMTILDSSPISEEGNHFLSEFRRHCYTYHFPDINTRLRNQGRGYLRQLNSQSEGNKPSLLYVLLLGLYIRLDF